MSWKSVPLSDAFWFQEGPGVRNWQFKTSGIKLLNVGNITKEGTIDLDKTDKHISLDEAQGKYRHFLADEGDLVIASSGISFDEDGMLRTRGAFIEKKHLPLCLNTSTIRFKAIEGISDLNFFKFWLDSFEFRDQVSRLVTGSAQQNFGPSHLKVINISLPPLDEQKRIASLLGRADRLRQLRRTGQELGDALLQSVFLEMFGDPKINNKRWMIGYINDLCEKVIDCPHATPIHSPVETEYASIRSSDIQNGYLDWSTTKYVDAEQYKKRIARGTPIAGDVVYCREGARFGNAARIPEHLSKKICLGQRMMLFRVNPQKATSEFLWAVLESPSIYKQAEDMVGGSAAPHVNIQDIKKFKTIIPPLDLQEEFVEVVRRVDGLRGRMGEAERQAEELFQGLLAQSFGTT